MATESNQQVELEAVQATETEKVVVEQGVHNYSSEQDWIKPEDPVLLERLEWFQDQKLGLMMHWGPYSQLGVVESWALSDKDKEWSRDGIDWEDDGETFKRQYNDLNKTFNPVRFQPEVWADLAAEGGFKYLIFTTKHHDGFCMWDTHTTDYRVTDKDCPFHTNKNADICREVFDAFRAKDIAIAAYFSKADWNTETYWAPGMERGNETSRGPSYDPAKYPWLWDNFVNFTHNQLEELLTKYGRIDILWLDAGWVGSKKQDIRLGEIVTKMREKQPWLLTADRTMGGLYENYVTPEQSVPSRRLSVPWESCITMGTSFSFRYEDDYKSNRELVHLLLEVVSKGGNLALNVGPQPDGRLPAGAIRCMKELGAWMSKFGEGIYGTRVCEPYFTNECALTRKDDTVYAFRMYNEQDQVEPFVHIPYTGSVERVDMVDGVEGLTFEQTETGIKVELPVTLTSEPAPIAHVFRIK